MPMFSPEIETLKADAIRKLQEKRFVKMVKYAYGRLLCIERDFRKITLVPDNIGP